MYANRSYIPNIGPELGVRGCDICQVCEGYIYITSNIYIYI